MNRIVVVDYGSSNLRSVVKALECVAGRDAQVTQSAEEATIRGADRVVFPGQGAMGQCMSLLHEQALVEVLAEVVRRKPFLGICLGLQSLMEHSDEDRGVRGLGVFPGQVRCFAALPPAPGGEDARRRKIPHMGWNRVRQSRAHPLWRGIPDGSRFYFVHSYYVTTADASLVVGRTHYICDYASALAQGASFAVQFHPEKSQQWGLQLLRNFVRWSP